MSNNVGVLIQTLKQDMAELVATMNQGATLTEEQIRELREIKDGFVTIRNKDIHNEAKGGAKMLTIADKWSITCESASAAWNEKL